MISDDAPPPTAVGVGGAVEASVHVVAPPVEERGLDPRRRRRRRRGRRGRLPGQPQVAGDQAPSPTESAVSTFIRGDADESSDQALDERADGENVGREEQQEEDD